MDRAGWLVIGLVVGAMSVALVVYYVAQPFLRYGQMLRNLGLGL